MSDPVEISDASVERIALRVFALQGGAGAQSTAIIDTDGAMKRLGYRSRKYFWKAVRRLGIPYERISTRHATFHASDVNAVLRQRQVGSLKHRRAA